MTSRKSFAIALLAAVAIFIAAHFLNFRGSVPEFGKTSGGGVLLNMKPEFSEDGVYQRIGAYSAPGRASYSFRLLTMDILLPLGLLPFVLLFMSRALKQTSLGSAARSIMLALPIAYVVLDLAENASLLAMLATFPGRLHVTAAVLPYLTVIKRVASLLSLFVPLLIYGFLFVRTQSRRLHPTR